MAHFQAFRYSIVYNKYVSLWKRKINLQDIFIKLIKLGKTLNLK